MALKFTEIEWCSQEYQASLELRHQVLRQPLGLKLTAEELDGEYAQRHFVILDEDVVVAVVVARPKSGHRVQLRQMAVLPDRQRQGIGTELIQQCESVLIQAGYTELQLNARATTVAFYEKLGYEPVGEPFQEISLPHQKMVKRR